MPIKYLSLIPLGIMVAGNSDAQKDLAAMQRE